MQVYKARGCLGSVAGKARVSIRGVANKCKIVRYEFRSNAKLGEDSFRITDLSASPINLDYTISDYGGEIQSVTGNNVGYGATGGFVFVGGRAGHRLGIRNSGATIVAEAAGKYACEYMTRGRVLILGPIENEVGSGMTGGELFVFDPRNEVPAKLHTKSVTVIDCNYVDYEWMHPLIIQYHARTGSRQAEHVLKNWADIRRGRRLRKVLPLAVARAMEDFKTVGTNAG